MDSLIKVELHLHSNFSDGMFSPEILADELAIADVKYAALTDHDSIDGLLRFKRAVARWGIKVVPGVEISTCLDGFNHHVLAYGFNPSHKALHHELDRNYKYLHPGFAGKINKVKSMWCRLRSREIPEAGSLIPIEEAFQLIHDAGGYTFLAHPFTLYQSSGQFNALIGEFKEWGLDGIEAYYKSYSDEQGQILLESAEQHGLVICSGSDFHGTLRPRLMDPGLKVPKKDIRVFCEMLGLGELTEETNTDESDGV